MKAKRKKKGNQLRQMHCPYCGAGVVYRSADGIYPENRNRTMLYVCSNYPKCDAYVRVHAGTKIPVGSLADHKLRRLRRTAHVYFNQLYKSGYMSRRDAYRWLADQLDAPLSEAHIGHMGEYYCQMVIEKSRVLLEHRRKRDGMPVAVGGGQHEAGYGTAEKGGRTYRAGT